MRIVLMILVLAAAALLPLAASAGEGDGGFTCTNACPLAKQANLHRADGAEAARTSPLLLDEIATVVAANLERI